jgi:hypothetical protein
MQTCPRHRRLPAHKTSVNRLCLWPIVKDVNEVIRMGRPCSICTSQYRAQIEDGAVAGDRLSRLARDYGVGAESVRRHLHSHVAPDVADALRAVEGLSPTTLVMRMQEVADNARDLRDLALDSRNMSAAVRAGDAELRALALLADRFGITEATVSQDLRLAGDLAQAVGYAASRSPEARALLVDALDRLGHRGFADNLRAPTTTNKGITT